MYEDRSIEELQKDLCKLYEQRDVEDSQELEMLIRAIEKIILNKKLGIILNKE